MNGTCDLKGDTSGGAVPSLYDVQAKFYGCDVRFAIHTHCSPNGKRHDLTYG